MSLYFRKREEQRAVTSVPWSHGGTSPLMLDSLEGSLSLVPVYAAVREIADAVSSLPLQAFRKTSDGRVQIPLPSMFETPTAYGSRVDWLQQCMTSLLLRGNAYGMKVGATGAGLPSMIEWLNPDKVVWNGNKPYYNGAELDERALLHIPAMLVPGCREGVSPLTACRSTVLTGAETQRFMREWYANKAVPGVIAKNTERTLDAGVAQTVKERLRESMRSGEPFVTGKDWDFDFLKLSADDAGFVTASKMTATQIANIYGVPPERIGGETGSSMTYSTTELDEIRFNTNTLRIWLVRLEQAFSSLLPKPQYVKFNVDARIRVDTKTRYEVHQIARNIGLNNIDELRALEDSEPLPNGAGEDYTPLAAKAAPAPAARSEVREQPTRPVELHSHTHLHQDGATIPVTVERSETVIPAPVVNIQNDVHVPDAPAPVVNNQVDVQVPESPAPVVHNEVNPTPVTVENTVEVQPADVVVAQPKRTATTTAVTRDRKGDITGSTATTEVIE